MFDKMKIKIILLIWFLISGLVDCGVLNDRLIKNNEKELKFKRFKRSSSNDTSSSSSLTNLIYSNNTENSNINLKSGNNLNDKNYSKDDDKQIHFTIPQISTNKWIPLPNHLIQSINSTSDVKQIEEQHYLDNGLIKVDPIVTSASDHSFIKNSYRRDEIAKKEPQVQYEEHEALLSLSELEKKLRDQLEQLENHKKIFNQQLPTSINVLTNSSQLSNVAGVLPSTPKYPVVQYENNNDSFSSFRSLVNNDKETGFNSSMYFQNYYSLNNKKPPTDYSTEFNGQANKIPVNTDHLHDVYAKMNYNPKTNHVNQFENYQNNQITSTETYYKNLPVTSIDNEINRQQRIPKPAEVVYQDKNEPKIDIFAGLLEHLKFNTSNTQQDHYTNSFQSTYQPPIDIASFATSQPDEYTYVYNHLNVPSQADQYKNFQNNQLQPYLYRPNLKNTLSTAIPMGYNAGNPINSFNSMNTINSANPTSNPNSNIYSKSPSEFSVNNDRFNRPLPVHQSYASYLTTTKASLSTMQPTNMPSISSTNIPSISPTSLPQNISTTTIRISNESPFTRNVYSNNNIPNNGISNVPNLNKIIESSSHLSQLNLNPRFIQPQKPNAYLEQPIKEYDLKSENNPNQMQYHLNPVNDKNNYVLLPEQERSTGLVQTYRNNQFNPTISPNMNSMNSMNPMNSMNSNSNSSPLQMINVKSNPSNSDYVKVYDEKTNEMYFIKTNDFNQLKTTNPKLDIFGRPTKDYYESSEATKELLKAVEAVKMAVIKVKPFKSLATRAVSDLASKLKDHLKSFAGSYSGTFPLSDLSEFSYDMKRDPVYLQHFDEFTGKVLNGESERKSSLFNTIKSDYAKPDFLLDNYHMMEPMEPMGLNSDRDTVKQNVTLGFNFKTNSSYFNSLNRQSLDHKQINQTATNFLSNKQKIDHFNRLIDEQKRSNQQKHSIVQTTSNAIQSNQLPSVLNLSSTSATGTYIRPGQTKYITKIAIKPNKPPVVKHFRYVQSINFKPALNEQQQMDYRQQMTRNNLPTNQFDYHYHQPVPLNEPLPPPLGLPRTIHSITNPSMNHPPMDPINYPPLDSVNHDPINTIGHSMNHEIDHSITHPKLNSYPEYQHSEQLFQPVNYRQINMNEQPMIVQESKQYPTYAPQKSPDNLTDFALFPTEFLRLTGLNNTNLKKNLTKNGSFKNNDLNKNMTKSLLVNRPDRMNRIKSTKNSTMMTNKIKLPELNFQYNPRFLPVKFEELNSSDKIKKNNLNRNSPIDKKKRKNEKVKKLNSIPKNNFNLDDEEDYYLPKLQQEYSSLNNLLNQNLLHQLFNEQQKQSTSINNRTALLSFEPVTTFDSTLQSFAPTPFTSIAPSSDWFDQAMIDIQNQPATDSLLSTNHPSIKYTPQSQLITIAASLPILHQTSIDLDTGLQNSLPFTYSSIKTTPNLFMTNNEQQNLNQIYQNSGTKQGQPMNNKKSNHQMNNQIDNKTIENLNKNKVDYKSSSAVPLINNLEFLNPIKNRLQKFYQRLVDGQQKKSRNQVTINFLNSRQETSTVSGNERDSMQQPMYKVLEFNEKNLREILNSEDDAELLQELLAEEKGQRRSDYEMGEREMFGFNKRILNTEESNDKTDLDQINLNKTDLVEKNQTDDEERMKLKKSLLDELLKSFYENSENLLKISKLFHNQTEKSDHMIDLSTDQSVLTHSIDDLTDSSDLTKTVLTNNLTNYRQLIDHFNREYNGIELHENNERNKSENQFTTNQQTGIRSIVDENVNLNKNKNYNSEKLAKFDFLTRLFNETGNYKLPKEKAVREKTQIEVYEKENLFDSSNEQIGNKTLNEKTKIEQNNFKDKKKVINFYHPSATWFTPTVVYDRVQTEKLTNRFGVRKNQNLNNNGLRNNSKMSKEIKPDNLRSESKLVENRQNINQLNPIKANKTGQLISKEKGIKIITEFELVHKDLTNSSDKAIDSNLLKPSFKVRIIENEFPTVSNLPVNQSNDKLLNKNLTFIERNELENTFDKMDNKTDLRFNWDNDEYRENVKKQIIKELPDIKKDELERIMKDFESQDETTINDESYKSQNNLKNKEDKLKNNDQIYSQINNQIYKPMKGTRKKKFIRKNLKNDHKPDFNTAQSQPEVTFNSFPKNRNRKYGSIFEKENCTKPSSKDDELMNEKILNQINNLLEQQFDSLRNELKVNKSTETNKESTNSEEDKEAKLLSKLAPDTNTEFTDQIETKFRASYIPENKYKIEKINGIRTVKNRPFINNILNQKKFNSVFKPSPIKIDKTFEIDKSFKIDESIKKPDETVSNQVYRKNSKEQDKFDFQREDGKLNIGDYDLLY